MKLDFKLNEKPTVEEKADAQPDAEAGDPLHQMVHEPELLPNLHTPIMIGEIEFTTTSKVTPPPKTMDWLHIHRVTLVQMVFSLITMICIIVFVFVNDLTRMLIWYKTGLFLWVLYLLLTGYCGYRSGSKNYPYAIAYFVMCIFQTMINAFWMAGVFLALCYAIVNRNEEVTMADVSSSRWGSGTLQNSMLAVEIIEHMCMLGTVFTGLLGASAGCRGFGRLLQYQDELITAKNTDNARY